MCLYQDISDNKKMKIKNNSKKIALILFAAFIYFSLQVNSIDINFDTNESIVQGFYDVKDETVSMLDKGLPVTPALNLINNGEIVLRAGDYLKLFEIINDIDRINRNVNNIFAGIKNAKIKINGLKELGFNLTSEENILSLAEQSFAVENFENAQGHIGKITGKLNDAVMNNSKDLYDNLRNIRTIQKNSKIETKLLDELLTGIGNAKIEGNYAYIIQVVNDLENINNSIHAISRVNKGIEKLEKTGKNTTRLKDMFLEANDAINSKDYETLFLVTDEIEYFLEIIENTVELINLTKFKLSELYYLDGINRINETLLLGLNEFSNENYEDAEELILESYDMINKLEAESLLFGALSVDKIKLNLITFVKDEPWIVVSLFIILAAFIIIITKIIKFALVRIYKKKIKSLVKEEKIIISLIKKNQIDYFIRHDIDKDSYKLSVSGYQERLVKIHQKIPVLNDRIERIRNINKNQENEK